MFIVISLLVSILIGIQFVSGLCPPPDCSSFPNADHHKLFPCTLTSFYQCVCYNEAKIMPCGPDTVFCTEAQVCVHKMFEGLCTEPCQSDDYVVDPDLGEGFSDAQRNSTVESGESSTTTVTTEATTPEATKSTTLDTTKPSTPVTTESTTPKAPEATTPETPEATTSEATKSTIAETTETPVSETTEPLTTETPETTTSETTEPPITETTELPTSEAPETTTLETTEPPTPETTEPPTPETTEPPTPETTEPPNPETTETVTPTISTSTGRPVNDGRQTNSTFMNLPPVQCGIDKNCTNATSRYYFPYAHDPKQYCQCMFTMCLPMRCPDGLVFNYMQQNCSLVSDNACDKTVDGNGSDTNSNNTSNQTNFRTRTRLGSPNVPQTNVVSSDSGSTGTEQKNCVTRYEIVVSSNCSCPPSLQFQTAT